VADGRPADRRPGLREALVVGGLVVVAVLLAAVVTFLIPGSGRDIVFRTPLLIVVLIGGTALVLWRITRPGRPER
jgi:peptidoglycan/LPS O-acetylase OafA/YrhL